MTGCRIFLFDDDGQVHRIAQRVFDGLRSGTDRMPQYADTSKRIAFVWLDLDGRKPNAVKRIDASYLHFDCDGEIDQKKSMEGMLEGYDPLGLPRLLSEIIFHFISSMNW